MTVACTSSLSRLTVGADASVDFKDAHAAAGPDLVVEVADAIEADQEGAHHLEVRGRRALLEVPLLAQLLHVRPHVLGALVHVPAKRPDVT